MKPLALSCAALAAALTLTACGEAAEAPEQDVAAPEDQLGTIVEVAQDNGDFTRLVAAVEAAGLEATLTGAGPFTLFAPTDTAFEQVPAAKLDPLMEEKMRPALVNLVTYHMVAGAMTFEEMEQKAAGNGGAFKMNTIRGMPLVVRVEQGNLTLEDMEGRKGTVTTVGVEASNGLIHVVDTVLFSEQ